MQKVGNIVGYLIKGGTVITESGEVRADVSIDDQRIPAIGKDLPESAERITLDATGKYVLPGVIDAHTHFALRSRGTVTADDFASGTKAAICGGVTTVIDFADQLQGMTLREAAQVRIDEAKPHVFADFALHMTVTKATDNIEKEMEDLLGLGVGAVKLFTTYRSAGYLLERDDFARVAKAAHRAGILITVHAEDNNLIENIEAQLKSKGMTAPSFHAVSRPAAAEELAITTTSTILGEAGIPVYFVHVSSEPGLRAVKAARRSGYTVYAETAPHYLVLDSGLYKRDDAREFIMTPPLRGPRDKDVLWKGILKGEFDVIATDHCSFTRKQKAKGTSCFDTLPGIPGVETLLPLIHHEGVVQRGMPLSELVRMLSYRPARLFGLYPKKGVIAEGADADIVIFDPDLEKTISSSSHHSKADYSPYEGMTVKGYPSTVFLRGEIAYDNGKFLGAPGSGRFVASKGPLGMNNDCR